MHSSALVIATLGLCFGQEGQPCISPARTTHSPPPLPSHAIEEVATRLKKTQHPNLASLALAPLAHRAHPLPCHHCQCREDGTQHYCQRYRVAHYGPRPHAALSHPQCGNAFAEGAICRRRCRTAGLCGGSHHLGRFHYFGQICYSEHTHCSGQREFCELRLASRSYTLLQISGPCRPIVILHDTFAVRF
jgi:hypothetical protein